MSSPESRKFKLPSGLDADVFVKGRGAPLVFLHSAYGRTWPAFLDRLAEQFTVYAPATPGLDEPDELASIDGFSDLALFYDDLLQALKVDTAVIVGHSFGGMAAAEFAAHHPNRVAALVLIDAMGLWIDATPVGDIHTTHPSKLGELMFSDPKGAIANSVLKPPTPEDRLHQQLALGAAVHYYWPIPDRDLKRRLYRIAAPTLLVWGANDKMVPALYADAFAAGIRGAKKVLIDGAAHFPHLEKPDEVARAITGFVPTRSTAAA